MSEPHKKRFTKRSPESQARFVAAGQRPETRARVNASNRKSLREKYERSVIRRGPDECWGWKPKTEAAGYTRIFHEGKSVKGSHVSLELAGKPKPFPGARALHSCDTPSCTNDAHLRWGTQKENVADMLDRERGANQSAAGYGWRD